MTLPGILSPAALAGMCALVGVAVFDSVVPRAPQEVSKRTLELQLQRKNRDVAETRAQLASYVRATERRVWGRGLDELGPFAMRTVGDWAADSGVRLTAMRPQKQERAGEATQVNFLATIEGSFPNFAAFLSAFEGSDSILSVRSFQLTSKDSEGTAVRANVGIVVYATEAPGG